MTDRPVLMSAPMVRALLEGRKTQTRRLAWHIVKLRPMMEIRGPLGSAPPRPRMIAAGFPETGPGEQWASTTWQRVRPGDRLWGKETWANAKDGRALYRADAIYDGMMAGDFGWDWRSPIYMPRRFSRITLDVTAVRMERLQDITEEDARAEGVEQDEETGAFWGPEGQGVCGGTTSLYGNAVMAYRALWDHLHGPGSWAANPEVVVLTFTVRLENIDATLPPPPPR